MKQLQQENEKLNVTKKEAISQVKRLFESIKLQTTKIQEQKAEQLLKDKQYAQSNSALNQKIERIEKEKAEQYT